MPYHDTTTHYPHPSRRRGRRIDNVGLIGGVPGPWHYEALCGRFAETCAIRDDIALVDCRRCIELHGRRADDPRQ